MKLVVDKLEFSYRDAKVLNGISFEANAGEFISILGPNGVGKSTLFKCILKILEPQNGNVLIDGASILKMPAEDVAKLIAYIPQSGSSVFDYKVKDMVLMGTTSQIGKFAMPGERQEKKAMEAMEMLGITHLKDKGYESISGGERQLTLIARAVAQQAHVLVMDEPSASLDFGNRTRLMEVVWGLKTKGYTVVQSTHDPEQAYRYSDKVLAMKNGKCRAFGPPDEVITSEIVSDLYGIDAEVIKVKEGVISCTQR